MENMVERVARALELGAFFSEADIHQGEHVRAARVVIEAMREPTERMDDAGLNKVLFAILADQPDPASVWTAMIDAALTPPGPTPGSTAPTLPQDQPGHRS